MNFQGSNQFKEKPKYLGLKKKTYINVLVLLAFIIIVSVIGKNFKNQENLTHSYQIKSQVYAQQVKELSVKPEQLSEHDQIILYIKEVFGKDSDKAFKVLSCENKSLNPNAVNDNEALGVGIGQDVGVFQINNHWQGVQGKFLKNWKVNVEIAYQIFKENGNFHLWTCGRRFGL